MMLGGLLPLPEERHNLNPDLNPSLKPTGWVGSPQSEHLDL